MPFVASVAKGIDVEVTLSMGFADALGRIAPPQFLQRPITNAASGVLAVDVLIAERDATVSEHNTARPETAAGGPGFGCHTHDAAIFKPPAVMANTMDGDGADPAEPAVVEVVQLMHVVAGLRHGWE